MCLFAYFPGRFGSVPDLGFVASSTELARVLGPKEREDFLAECALVSYSLCRSARAWSS